MKIILHWILMAAAVFIIPYAVSGISISSIFTAIIVAAVLGFINTIVKPIISLLTLPINILTLGLFSIVLNALFFWGVSTVISGFTVSGFVPALIGSIILSIVNWILAHALK